MRGNGGPRRPSNIENLDPRPRLGCRRALLLQGPNGPFFARLAKDLKRGGTSVTKVNFNVADSMFYRGPDVISFRDSMDKWPERLREIMVEEQIDAVFLFGDQRPIHLAATKLARELGIAIWVFEEGYLRPDFVTCERNGVNGNSELPRDPEHYRTRAPMLPEPDPVTPVGNTFWQHTTWTILASVGKTFGWFRYPRYVHHRRTDAFYGAFCYTRGAFRKLRYRITERGVVDGVIARNDGKYFVLPLQVYCDAQLQHSDFPSMPAMIEHVVATFAAAAPADSMLVVKHHPHDMPFRDYKGLLRQLAAQHGLGDRVVYIHDTHLPTLLKHARGVVTMNSTVGPSALFHHTPVKVLGRATYDIAGMTSQKPLAEFFQDPGQVDGELFDAYTHWLKVANQVNGSFYRRVNPETASGLPPTLFDRVGETADVAEGTASAALVGFVHDRGAG
ncbi:MAG: capsular biosynthesis protein [Deltaproteobacteria bacterium]|nr:capsular biosynthesis protein [Deltaproteobacteria bacterium]